MEGAKKMERQGKGIMEAVEKYRERQLMKESEGIKPDDLQVPIEPAQNGEQQPKMVRKVRPYSAKKSEENKQLLIGLEKEPPFSQRYTRVTTYLENSLNEIVKALNRDGRISSVTALVNAALTEFLDKHGIQ